MVFLKLTEELLFFIAGDSAEECGMMPKVAVYSNCNTVGNDAGDSVIVVLAPEGCLPTGIGKVGTI